MDSTIWIILGVIAGIAVLGTAVAWLATYMFGGWGDEPFYSAYRTQSFTCKNVGEPDEDIYFGWRGAAYHFNGETFERRDDKAEGDQR